jgi:hypothetical protein
MNALLLDLNGLVCYCAAKGCFTGCLAVRINSHTDIPKNRMKNTDMVK